MPRYRALDEGQTPLELGGEINYHRNWLPTAAADALLAEVEATGTFRQERLSGSWQQPRETAWFLRWYPPSSKYQRYWVAPTPGPLMQKVIDIALCDYDLAVNAVLLNRYRHGDDSVLPHADDEPTLGGPVILSLSLGATRRFKVRPADCSASPERLHAQLGHGDLHRHVAGHAGPLLARGAQDGREAGRAPGQRHVAALHRRAADSAAVTTVAPVTGLDESRTTAQPQARTKRADWSAPQAAWCSWRQRCGSGPVLNMPNSEASIPDSATSLLTSAGAHSERAAAQAAYLALVQHLSGLPQDHFDAEVPSEASSITVGIRIVS